MQYIDLEQTVNEAISGSETGFRKLYDLTGGRAYYAALCVTRKESDAVNIMQNAYSIMRERLARLKYPQMFENWFYRIVCQRIYDYEIKRNPNLFDSYNTLEADNFNDELDARYFPDEAHIQRDKVTVTTLLDRLSVDRKLCFLMYYYFDMGLEEMSNVLSVEKNTLAYFLNEAKKIVKVNLKDELISQSRSLDCPVIVYFSGVLKTCSSHIPFKATDMIFKNLFSVHTPDMPLNTPRTPVLKDVTVSENDSTQMYSGEEIDELLGKAPSRRPAPYGKESSKGGPGDDDIPSGKSAAKIAKIVIIILVAVIFIVALAALIRNVLLNNGTATTTTTTQTTSEVTKEYEYPTAATSAPTTEPIITTEPPTTQPTTEPPTQQEETQHQEQTQEQETEPSFFDEITDYD